MSECKKTLHQAASTLKKNPDRIQRLVKAAGIRIVPPSQYAKGATRKSLEDAVKKLKQKSGLNGTKEPGVGYFSKEAADRKDVAVAAGTTASGALVGASVAQDLAKSRVKGRIAQRNNIAATKNPGGIEGRLAASAKKMGRMKKPLAAIARKGGIAGAVIGAGLGATALQKKAAAPAKMPAVLPKGMKIPAGAKDVSPKAVRLARAAKGGKIALGVAAAAGIAAAAKHKMEKKAEKDSNVGGMATVGALAAGARRGYKDVGTAAEGMSKQLKHIRGKGKTVNMMDVRMAMDSFKKPIGRRVLKASGKGAIVGALAGAAMDRMGHKKKAAEAVTHKGVTYRRGTIGSAAKKMAIGGGVIGGAAGASVGGPAGALFGGTAGSIASGMYGGAYGLARSALRGQKGERSLSPADFDHLKSTGKLRKQASALVIKDGKKYRKGTPASASMIMGAIGANTALSKAIPEGLAHRKAGVPVPKAFLAKKVGKAAAAGAATGFLYAKARGVARKLRGETSVGHRDFRDLKKTAADTVGAKGDREMKKLVESNGKKGSMAQMPGKDKGPK